MGWFGLVRVSRQSQPLPLTLLLGLILEGNKEAAPGQLRAGKEGTD